MSRTNKQKLAQLDVVVRRRRNVQRRRDREKSVLLSSMATVAASSPATPNTLAMFAKRFSKPNATPVLMFATDQKTKKTKISSQLRIRQIMHSRSYDEE